MCAGITAVNRNYGRIVLSWLWRHRWWHKHYKDGICQSALHRLPYLGQFKLWSNFLKSHMVTRGGVTRTLKPKVNPKIECHSSLATCKPYIPFFHLDTILIDRVIAKYQGHLVKLWPCPLTYDIEKSRVLRSFPDMHTQEIWLRYYSYFTGHWSSN